MITHLNLPDIIIAVDGFSATGKSTFAKLVAKEFGFLYLDSGALYRGVTLFAQEQGLIEGTDRIDTERLYPMLGDLDLHFGPDGLYIGERCIEKEIRSLKVSSSVSPVAVLAPVREWVDGRLHEYGRRGRVIMDGRDIGTAVFPDAQLKIFMVADDNVRAQRRFDEMVAKGESPSMEDVLKNLRERDYIDSHRETNPLRQAPDAYVMDNSDMTLHEETVWFRGLVQGKFGILC
ncbi:MAG: (d)CMP kinase [Candidatus Cryptobacteroides sp.]